jgi:predicted dehydrogenase
VQIGAGSASDDIWHQARELIGDGGAGPIGKPLHFQTSYNRNVPGGDWNYEIFEDANAQTVDWERWQAPAARHRAWEDGGAERFFRFRKYWDYSGGLATDLLYHKLAHMALALGFPFPRRVSAVGGKYLHFDRDVPDTLTVQAEFENNCIGTLLATSGNDLNIEEAIRGEHGTMTFERGALVVRPQRAHMAAVAEKASKLEDVEIVEGRSGGRTVIESIRRRARPRSEHMLNFIECMRSRGKPHLDAEAGYRVMTTIGLSVEAYREGRTKRFDPAREETIES